jgi:hypothetical protein
MLDLQIIKTYNTKAEAEIDRVFLESNSIKGIILADDCGGAEPNLAFSTGGYKLALNKKYYKRALKILNL